MRKYNGTTPTRTFLTWKSMHLRCYSPLVEQYPRYGGRGIKVCKRWHSFDKFVEDMGIRPAHTTIDRINNDGDYKPSNCRWATTMQQAGNRCGCVYVTRKGKRQHITAWAKEIGIKPKTMLERYRRGMRGSKLFRPLMIVWGKNA
jgi:hypothetical protein